MSGTTCAPVSCQSPACCCSPSACSPNLELRTGWEIGRDGWGIMYFGGGLPDRVEPLEAGTTPGPINVAAGAGVTGKVAGATQHGVRLPVLEVATEVEVSDPLLEPLVSPLQA